VDEGEAGVADPPLGFEGYRAGVTEDDDAPQTMSGSGVAAFPPVTSDSIDHHEMTAMNVNADSVAVCDADAVRCGVAAEGSGDGRY
jgi:hypothetical protein